MSSSNKNLSHFSREGVQDVSDKVFAVVVSEWNEEVTEALYSGVVDTLVQQGATKEKIIRKNVPGSFELPMAAQWLAEKKEIDAIICLGCIIQGETRHFDFIAQAVAQGIMEINLKYNKPVVFGVLTPDTLKQALDRAGGKYGNKGDEAAITAVKMLNLKSNI